MNTYAMIALALVLFVVYLFVDLSISLNVNALFLLSFNRNRIRQLKTLGNILILEEKAHCFRFQRDLCIRVHFRVSNLRVIEATDQSLSLMNCRVLAISMYLRKR